MSSKLRVAGIASVALAAIMLGVRKVDVSIRDVQPYRRLFDVFPIARWVNPTFSDDFGAARMGNRTHNGVDIFAPKGTAVRAVADGALTHGTGELGGNYAHVLASDGTRYYYAHLSQYEGNPRSVKAGDTIGYVGDTGNAKGTPPHLHFEVHAANGVVNPYMTLRELANAPDENS